jgi:hypothetical protein
MRLSSIACASVLALAAAALTTDGASAAPGEPMNHSSSRHDTTDTGMSCGPPRVLFRDASTHRQSCLVPAAAGHAGRRGFKEYDKMSCQASGGAWQCQDSSHTGTWTVCECFMQANEETLPNPK